MMKCKNCKDWVCVQDEEEAKSNYKKTGLCFVCAKALGVYKND